MKRLLFAAPTAFLTTACALRPWTPSVVTSYGNTDSPPLRIATLPAQADALARWQLPASNRWAQYAKYTLLTSLDAAPQNVELPDVAKVSSVVRADIAAYRIAQAGIPDGTLWIVDLRGAASATFGASLSRRATSPVACVPTFNNWPADGAMVPAEETLAALVYGIAPRIPAQAEGESHPVFLLDAWRLAFRDDRPPDDVVDNRYMLNPSDFPDADVLRRAGITRVVYVVEDLDETELEEDDLNALFVSYRDAGIAISMLDLDLLQRELKPSDWDRTLVRERLNVTRRPTLIDSPLFFSRAHGGFGGTRAAPSPFRPGAGFGRTSSGHSGGFGG